MRKPTLGAPKAAPTASAARPSQNRTASVVAGSGAGGSASAAAAGAGASAGALGRLRSFRVSALTFVVLGMLILFVVIVAPSLRVFIEQRQQIAQLEQSVAAQQGQVTELSGQVARWSDPAYIKAQARNRLYYVMPGETSFLIIDDVPATPGAPTQPATKSLQETKVDWLSALFSSGMSAGLSTQTPDQLKQSGSVQ